MNNAWEELRKRNERENKIREREERLIAQVTLFIAPAIPAIFWLIFSDALMVDVVGKIRFLDSVRDVLGIHVVAYGTVFVYFALIGLLLLIFPGVSSARSSIIIAWLAWGWFYFSVWKLENLRYAFVGLAILVWFKLRIVAFLVFCYQTIREGMFLTRDDHR